MHYIYIYIKIIKFACNSWLDYVIMYLKTNPSKSNVQNHSLEAVCVPVFQATEGEKGLFVKAGPAGILWLTPRCNCEAAGIGCSPTSSGAALSCLLLASCSILCPAKVLTDN